MIRRGDVTNIAWVFARLEMNLSTGDEFINWSHVDNMPPKAKEFLSW